MLLKPSTGKHATQKEIKMQTTRHTLADHLKQKGIVESLVGGILGHQSGGITFSRYGKDFRPEVLAPVIEAVDFDVVGWL